MVTRYKFLTLAELQQAAVFMVVWDKCGNKYFKLVGGEWAGETLAVSSSEQLFKLSVKPYTA